MRPEDVWPATDLSAAAWLGEALSGGPESVNSVVPDGYEAYVEIPLDGPTFWEVRDVLARHTDPDAPCWFAILEAWPLPPTWREAPTFRTPEGELLLFAGRFRDAEVVAVELATAQYALSGLPSDVGFDGIAAAMRAARSHQEPSLWWPEDRAWVLAREIDSDCLYLASTSSLADDVVATRSLDARVVAADAMVSIEE